MNISDAIENIACPQARVLAYALMSSLQGEPLPDAASPDFDHIRDALVHMVRNPTEDDLRHMGIAALAVLHGHLHAHVRTAQALLQQQAHVARGGPLQ